VRTQCAVQTARITLHGNSPNALSPPPLLQKRCPLGATPPAGFFVGYRIAPVLQHWCSNSPTACGGRRRWRAAPHFVRPHGVAPFKLLHALVAFRPHPCPLTGAVFVLCTDWRGVLRPLLALKRPRMARGGPRLPSSPSPLATLGPAGRGQQARESGVPPYGRGVFIGCRGWGLAMRLGALIAPPRLRVAAWLPLWSCRLRFALPLDAADTPDASPVSPPASVASSLCSSAPLFPAPPAPALFDDFRRRSLKKTVDTAGCPRHPLFLRTLLPTETDERARHRKQALCFSSGGCATLTHPPP
jgi:hypothetical protein